jgi:uncharacterized protein involved in outer membrane biogenesis
MRHQRGKLTRRRRLATAVIAVALIAIGGEILVESISIDGVVRLVESRLSKATGLDVRTGGDFHLEILPVLRFEANSVTVTDPQAPSSPLLTVGTLLLDLDPWPLLHGVISIDELELLHAELILGSSAASDASRLSSDAAPPFENAPDEPSDESALFRIHKLDAEDLRIVYRAGTAEPGASLEIEALALRADELDEMVSVAIRGSFDGSRVEVSGEIGALSQLSRSSAPYPVSLRARIGEIEAKLTGSIQDPLSLKGVQMDAHFTASDLASIGDLLALEIPLPPIGPVTATAALRKNSGALAAENLVLRVGRREETWLEMDGSIGDIADFRRVQLVAKFGVTDLRDAQSLIDRELPDVGPIRGEFTLSDRDDTLGIEMFHVSGGREGAFAIDFSGGIDNLLERDEIELAAKIGAKHLAIVGSLFGVDLPAIGPVSFDGQLNGTDEKITARGSTRFDDTVFVGSASGSFAPGARRLLQVRIQSDLVRLEDVGIEPRKDQPEPVNVEGADAGNWWSGDTPLPFLQNLRILDAAFALEANRVTGRSGFELKQLRLDAQLDGGNLVISAVAAGRSAGTMRAEAHVGANASTPSLALKARADDVDLTTLTAQLKEDTESEGLLDALVDLESRGHAPAEIRSNLSGSALILIKNGALASRYGSEFVKNVAKLSLPSLMIRSAPRFGCIVAEFQIADGIANVDHLVLDSDNARVVGSGTIDIGGDAFDLMLKPTAKKPDLLNLAAVVDVSGPLTAPVFKPQLRTVPGNVARGLISNVLAPGSALIEPFRKRAETDALCARGLPIEPNG